MSLSDWDLDLRDGQAGEGMVANLLSLETIEVKTDRRWVETGNIYIETECWYNKSQTWEPSGIRVSKASHWAYVLENSVIIVPTEMLREMLWESPYKTPIECNIEPNPSKGFLITPANLLEYVRKHHAEKPNQNHGMV